MTTQTLTLVIPTAAMLNANQRPHWAVKAKRTKAIRTLAHLTARAQMTGPMDRAHLVVHVGWPDHRRRDVANVGPTLKAAIDGFVDAGLLADDDDTHLTGPDLRPYVAGVRGEVSLRFEFTEVVV